MINHLFTDQVANIGDGYAHAFRQLLRGLKLQLRRILFHPIPFWGQNADLHSIEVNYGHICVQSSSEECR